MLVLPIAIPTYIAAYAFVEFFHFAGPVQSALRAMTGYQSARDYWFPNVRSLGGAALILSLVLYPYVYLAARMVFTDAEPPSGGCGALARRVAAARVLEGVAADGAPGNRRRCFAGVDGDAQ